VADVERPLVAVVCSYRNAEWAERNLDSIFNQEYSNFRLIYVDDCSPDNNAQIVRDYIKKHGLEDRVIFISNTKRHRKLANLYKAFYLCHDDEIVVMVDGDDWLAHSQVFKKINALYQDESLWLTYGQYKNVPVKEAERWGWREKGYCRAIPKHIVDRHAYRQYAFVYMHPRTFRAWLFKLVRLEDLLAETVDGYKGDFYPAANDNAFFYPMVEMAHTHIKFISDILYIRNLYNEIVGFKVDHHLQKASAHEIRKKSRYPVLRQPKTRDLEVLANASADVFILCKNKLDGIEKIIKNIQERIINVGSIFVFSESTYENRSLSRAVKKDCPHVFFIPFSDIKTKTLKKRMIDFLQYSTSDHILFMTDSFSIEKSFNISELIYWLEKTYAYGFFLSRSSQMNNVPTFVQIDDEICAWKFLAGTDTWSGDMKNADDMILFNKNTLLKMVRPLFFRDKHELVAELKFVNKLYSGAGLFFKKSKVKLIN